MVSRWSLWAGIHARSFGVSCEKKDKLLGKIVFSILTDVKLQSRKIVVTAHTNEAVRVAYTRTMDLAHQTSEAKHP